MSLSRRQILRTSAGFAAVALASGLWSCEGEVDGPLPDRVQFKFRRHKADESAYRVTVVTPEDWHFIHTFFDVCPLSPSQRYLAVTRFPYDDRQPQFGDLADVCVVDLETETLTKLYSTGAWGTQLGANVQWGNSDRYLYTNDIIDGVAVCVRIDREGGARLAYAGPKYDIAPDERDVIGFPLDLINATQLGYGVPEPDDGRRQLTEPMAKDQGLWRTDLTSNRSELLMSIWDLAQVLPDKDELKDGVLYFFHSKYNRQKTRILQVMRWLENESSRAGRKNMLTTFRADGADTRLAVDRELWGRGGNHPNWHPDGERIVMNLTPVGETMRFCVLRYDGTDLRILSERIVGSGHPSMEPSGRYLISDAYANEPMANADKEVPIRLVDLSSDSEEPICFIYTLGITGILRLDPHPVWSRDYKRVIFNGAPEKHRQVLIAEVF